MTNKNQKIKPRYRPNVGIVLVNDAGQVWWGKRADGNAWQFPQGGIDDNEAPLDAMFRELYEETGLTKDNVTIVAESKKWYTYNFPKNKNHANAHYTGQRQKYFLLKLKSSDVAFNLDITKEFVTWRWVSYWYPIRQIVYFKEEVYRKVLKEFSKHIFST